MSPFPLLPRIFVGFLIAAVFIWNVFNLVASAQSETQPSVMFTNADASFELDLSPLNVPAASAQSDTQPRRVVLFRRLPHVHS